jgi:hypothetical protein
VLTRIIKASAIGIAVQLPSSDARSQQPSAQRVYTAKACKPVVTPWTNVPARIDRVTATATMLDRQWLSDPRRSEADLTKLMVGYPVVLRFAVTNASGCRERSCACPRTAKAAATTLSQTLDPALARDPRTALDRLFRQDSVSTFTGAMLFLREHPEFVRHVSDSLARVSALRSARSTVRPRPPGS